MNIVISPETFGGFAVEVIPAPDGIGHDRTFAHLALARRYAIALATATGWQVVDRAADQEAARVVP